MKEVYENLIGAVVGPTGVGKTESSLRWAEKENAEIISADSRQIYRKFKIGTAQPSEAERARVRHHLIDFLSPDEKFSTGAFVKSVKTILRDNPQKKFLIAGGTGFYIKTLFEGLSEDPQVTLEIEADFAQREKEQGLEKLRLEIEQFDPVAFAKIAPNDAYRIKKAWTIFHSTQRPWSDFLNTRVEEGIEAPLYFLNRPREELYQRINARTKQMIDQGWLKETQNLLEQGVSAESAAMQTLGYPEMRKVLAGKATMDQAMEWVAQSTRRYAKRQITFFKNQFANFESFAEL